MCVRECKGFLGGKEREEGGRMKRERRGEGDEGKRERMKGVC